MLEILATLEEYQRIFKNDQIIAVKFEDIAEINYLGGNIYY